MQQIIFVCPSVRVLLLFMAPVTKAPRLLSTMASGFFEAIATPTAFKFYLNGEWKESASGGTTGIKNPQTNEVAFNVQACNKEEVDAAFDGAVQAQKQWATTPLWKRGELVKAAAAVLREHADAIAPVLTTEVAKQAKSARSEVIRSAELMEYCAEEGVRYLGEGSLLTSDSFPGTDRNKLCLASKVPLGVVLCIPPFNYPVNLAVSKLAPALMAGNAVVGVHHCTHAACVTTWPCPPTSLLMTATHTVLAHFYSCLDWGTVPTLVQLTAAPHCLTMLSPTHRTQQSSSHTPCAAQDRGPVPDPCSLIAHSLPTSRDQIHSCRPVTKFTHDHVVAANLGALNDKDFKVPARYISLVAGLQ